MRLDYPDGGWCDVRLLRTVKWIEQTAARVGGKIFLDLSEVGTRGWAKVLDVRPCGRVEIGPGDMVTGTFRHSHGRVGELILESEPTPIGVTPGHLFWSGDRQAWVPVSSLHRGETVQTMKGLTHVISYSLTDPVEPVYNLEVEGSHCYQVGESGVLVHNMSANSNLNVVTATASAFRAEDCSNPRFYIFATLVSGVLRFEVVAQLASGARGSVSGKEFFAAMMAHFGARVRIIEANWSRASGLTTTTDQLNRATAAGLSVEDAAPLTWTGRRASEYGYDKVTVIHALPPRGARQVR